MSTNTAAKAAQQSRFAALPQQNIPRSRFPLDFRRLHTFKAGDLVPVVCIPMLPGDDIRGQVATLVRLLSPLERPMMDNLYLDWFAFFGASRLLWKNFERFQGARENPGDSVDYTIPYLQGGSSSGYNIGFGGIADGLGFPKGSVNSNIVKISALPHRMYHMTWNQWFRDQTYQDSVLISSDPNDPIGDGPDSMEDELLKRGKRPDYFSSALDAPQMGPGIPIPWDNDGQAPVYGNGNVALWEDIGTSATYSHLIGGTEVVSDGSWTTRFSGFMSPTGVNLVSAGGSPSNVYADVGAVSATLNAFRVAIVLQQISELDKRGGLRYVETLRSRWNVVTRDDRLQRIEYVGGGSSVIGAHNVVQTSASVEGSAQGNLTAYMKGGFAGGLQYRAPEHGYLMIMINVRARITYQQQLSRHWTRRTRHDFPEPLTMHLGEEPVFLYEMFYPPSGASAEYMTMVWGWQERWAIDRYTPSIVSGMFDSEHPQSLDTWHMAIDYNGVQPVHDGEWIQDNPPVERVVKFPSQDVFMLDFAFSGSKVSSMPVMSIPGLSRI